MENGILIVNMFLTIALNPPINVNYGKSDLKKIKEMVGKGREKTNEKKLSPNSLNSSPKDFTMLTIHREHKLEADNCILYSIFFLTCPHLSQRSSMTEYVKRKTYLWHLFIK